MVAAQPPASIVAFHWICGVHPDFPAATMTYLEASTSRWVCPVVILLHLDHPDIIMLMSLSGNLIEQLAGTFYVGVARISVNGRCSRNRKYGDWNTLLGHGQCRKRLELINDIMVHDI